jgi:hypothetical protein
MFGDATFSRLDERIWNATFLWVLFHAVTQGRKNKRLKHQRECLNIGQDIHGVQAS